MRRCIYVNVYHDGDIIIDKVADTAPNSKPHKVYSGAQLWHYLRQYLYHKDGAIIFCAGRDFIPLHEYKYMDAIRDFQRLRPSDAKQLTLNIK